MKYSDVVASLSLVFAIVVGILNYIHTKRSVRNAMSPYLRLRPKTSHDGSSIHSLELEIQNLHHEISVDNVHLKATFIAFKFPNPPEKEKINNSYLRKIILRFLTRTKWFTSNYNFIGFSGQDTDIIKPREILTVSLPVLESQDLWIEENILQKKNDQFFVIGIDTKSKRHSSIRYPHINLNIELSYTPAVYPINCRKDIYKYEVTPIGDSFPSGRLIEWSIAKRNI